MKYKEYEIEKLNIAVVDGDRGKNYPHQDELLDMGECVFLSANNVTQMGFKFDSVMFITKEKDNILRKGKLQRNDIVITTRGTIGNVAFYDDSVHFKDMRINSGMLIVRCFEGVDSEYLYNVFRSIRFQKQIKQIQTGTAQPQLPKSHFLKMKVILPPIHIQKKITSIIGSIDKKIKYNKKINDNLQQQAQAIYVSMFVSNVSSDWQQGHLSDLITVKYGKDHKKLADGNYPVYGSGGIMRYVERPLYDKESVLIPRKGTLNNVMYVNQPFWSVDTMFYTEMRMPNIAKFIYHFVKNKNLASMNAGSAVPSMTTDILNAMEIAIPSTSEFEEFETIVSPMYHAMQENNIQSAKLAELRDSLLPKFMSGEIDVSAIRL